MPRFLCFFKLLLDWDAVRTEVGGGVGEQAAGMEICCDYKNKNKKEVGNIYIQLFTCRTVGEEEPVCGFLL